MTCHEFPTTMNFMGGFQFEGTVQLKEAQITHQSIGFPLSIKNKCLALKLERYSATKYVELFEKTFQRNALKS